MKKALIITIVVLSCIQINAQTLTGLVYDKDTKQPIADAYVFIGGTQITDITENTGRFTLTVQQLIVNAKLVLSHIAYQTIIIDDPFNNVPDTIYMEGQVNILEEVIIRDRRKERIEERDLKVNLVNVVNVPMLLQKQPNIRTLVDVLDSQVPGVSVRYDYNTGLATAIISRAATFRVNKEPLVVIDGTPIGSFNDANIMLNNLQI